MEDRTFAEIMKKIDGGYKFNNVANIPLSKTEQQNFVDSIIKFDKELMNREIGA
jgi:hypothetical protein